MADCENLLRCGFFIKYQETLDLACRGFINQYCSGPKQLECARRTFKVQHGHPPDDDMLPSGQMMPKSFADAARH
ncbi:MAG: hypothetical protein WA208_08030 [Thermoanaerobaculia bacterium]